MKKSILDRAEVYLEPTQSNIFDRTFNYFRKKSSIVDVQLGSKYASVGISFILH